MSELTEEVSLENPIFGKLKARGSDVLVTVFGTFVVAGMCVLGYVMWEHKAEDLGNKVQLTNAIKEMTSAQREQNMISREQVCLLAMPQDRREREFSTENSLCKRLSRER